MDMEYTKTQIFEKIEEKIRVVYLVDLTNDSYKMMKDTEIFHGLFGDSGSYTDMVRIFHECTIDKAINKNSPYGTFIKEAKKFSGTMANNAKMRIGKQELFISLSTLPVDEDHIVIMVSDLKESDYIKDIHKDQQMNTMKAAYLFSMNVDLNLDKCESMNMSESSDYPVNDLDISYTAWRQMIVNMFLPQDQEMFLNMSDPQYLRENLEYHQTKSLDFQMLNIEGEFIWVKLIFNRIDTGNEKDFCFLFMVEDIHESHMRLMEDMKKFEKLANTDSLTRLLNHGGIENEIRLSIERCRQQEKKVSLLMLDIDYFKRVNDTHGHVAGDEVLKDFANVLKSHVILYNGKVGRWGGEEFIGVCEDVSLEEISRIGEEIRGKIEGYSFGIDEKITSSVGVIEVNEQEAVSDALERVDTALYQAKNNGRNQVYIDQFQR